MCFNAGGRCAKTFTSIEERAVFLRKPVDRLVGSLRELREFLYREHVPLNPSLRFVSHAFMTVSHMRARASTSIHFYYKRFNFCDLSFFQLKSHAIFRNEFFGLADIFRDFLPST